MRRVVVTGMGIVSCLGKNKEEVLTSLQEGKSGISHQPEYAELGFKSHIAGSIAGRIGSLLRKHSFTEARLATSCAFRQAAGWASCLGLFR